MTPKITQVELRSRRPTGGPALAALATPNHLRLNTDKPSGRRNRLGYSVHDGSHHLGHTTRAEADFLVYHHAVRCLTAHPEAGALWIEAQDTETLNLLGRAMMRRLARGGAGSSGGRDWLDPGRPPGSAGVHSMKPTTPSMTETLRPCVLRRCRPLGRPPKERSGGRMQAAAGSSCFLGQFCATNCVHTFSLHRPPGRWSTGGSDERCRSVLFP